MPTLTDKKSNKKSILPVPANLKEKAIALIDKKKLNEEQRNYLLNHIEKIWYKFCDKLNDSFASYVVKEPAESYNQHYLFDVSMLEKMIDSFFVKATRQEKKVFYRTKKNNYFELQNRRFLGNKFKLLGFIEEIIDKRCGKIESLCDIFAGTGVVGNHFNKQNIKIITNDLLKSNFVCLQAFLGTKINDEREIEEKIDYLNSLNTKEENYFSKHYGNTYFSLENARKIGSIRDKIDGISDNEQEKNILICSLIYSVDRIANTVGHYDAFRRSLDMIKPLKLEYPRIEFLQNYNNKIYNEDANKLIRKIKCDVLYLDPPYNSRQYSDAYHLLENLTTWQKPKVYGVCKKMNRTHLKSEYCYKDAPQAFQDLIENADCKHILLSYNNTAKTKHGRSNARISDDFIIIFILTFFSKFYVRSNSI